MKKNILIFTVMVLGSLISVQAQSTISFEDTEGYSAGEINGQNNWEAGDQFSSLFLVSDERASEGTFSFKAQQDENIAVDPGTIVGVSNSAIDVVSGNLSVSVDVYLEAPEAGVDSEIDIIVQSVSDNSLSSRVAFVNGQLLVVNTNPENPEELSFQEAGSFSYGTWLAFKTLYNFDDNEVRYYIDEELVFTGEAFGSPNVDNLAFFFSNATDFFVDNVVLDDNPDLSLPKQQQSKLTHYVDKDELVIQSAQPIKTLAVYNMLGQQVVSYSGGLKEELRLNIASYTSGVYIVKTRLASGEQSSFKILKD